MITFGQGVLVCGFLLALLTYAWGDVMPLGLQLLFPFLPIGVMLSSMLWIFEGILCQRAGRWSFTVPLLGVLLVLLCFGIPNVTLLEKSDSSQSIRILSWNAQQLGNDTAKVQQAIALIDALDPDIVFLQEFGLYYKWPDVGAVAKDFSERTGLKHYDFTPHPGNIFGTACFSKHPILEVDTIFQLLSVTNEAKRYTLEVNGDSLTVVNAHLMSYNFFGNDSDASWTGISETIAARSEQALQIQHAGFDLMFGDLNAAPGDGVYRQIRAHYNDAFQGVLEPTHEVLPVRIDHCFYTDQWRLTAADYRSDFPSDHKALLVAFERNK